MAALGAVTAFDDWAPTRLADAPLDVIERELASVVQAIVGLPKPARAAGRARTSAPEALPRTTSRRG
jgi:hypothetical protein